RSPAPTWRFAVFRTRSRQASSSCPDGVLSILRRNSSKGSPMLTSLNSNSGSIISSIPEEMVHTLDGVAIKKSHSHPFQTAEYPPLKKRYHSDQRAGQNKTVGVVRTRNAADIDAQQPGEKAHRQEEAGDDTQQIHGAIHPFSHAPLFGLQDQVGPFSNQLQLFEISYQAIAQLVPVIRVVIDKPGKLSARELRVDLTLWQKEATQACCPPAQGKQVVLRRRIARIGFKLVLFTIHLFCKQRDQILHMLGQCFGKADQYLRSGFRPLACSQLPD